VIQSRSPRSWRRNAPTVDRRFPAVFVAPPSSRTTRVLGFGPVSGYFHVQFFAGYGEDILDYNRRFKSQLRLGFAIVP